MLINDLKLLCTQHVYQHHSEFGMVVPVLFREILRAGEVLQPAWNHIAQINYESGNVSFQGILASVCASSTFHGWSAIKIL